MSLNWDATKCDERALEDSGAREVTKALVFATMAIDMGQITEGNHEEFYERVRAYENLRGAFLTVRDGNRVVDRPITLDDVRLRIGLRTNVPTRTKGYFNRNLARLARER